MEGHVKIHRRMLEWEWYSNINTSRVFIHMLLKANWKDGKFQGREIKRGSFVSSLTKISDETSLTVNEVRTAIRNLKLTGEITGKSYSKYTVFTIKNYDLYQDINTQEHTQITIESPADNPQLTGKSQPVNKLLTTIEERKNNINILCAAEPTPESDTRHQDFDKIYAIYPKKRGKAKALEYYLAFVSKSGRLLNGKRYRLSPRDVYLAVSRYVNQQEQDGTALQFYKNFDSFMHKTILDYLEEQEE